MSDDLRVRAAKAARQLKEAARREDDVREMLTLICARLECRDVFDLADREPQQVIDLAENVGLLEEQTLR